MGAWSFKLGSNDDVADEIPNVVAALKGNMLKSYIQGLMQAGYSDEIKLFAVGVVAYSIDNDIDVKGIFGTFADVDLFIKKICTPLEELVPLAVSTLNACYKPDEYTEEYREGFISVYNKLQKSLTSFSKNTDDVTIESIKNSIEKLLNTCIKGSTSASLKPVGILNNSTECYYQVFYTNELDSMKFLYRLACLSSQAGLKIGIYDCEEGNFREFIVSKGFSKENARDVLNFLKANAQCDPLEIEVVLDSMNSLHIIYEPYFEGNCRYEASWNMLENNNSETVLTKLVKCI